MERRPGLEWKQMLEIISASVVGSPLVNYKAGPIEDRNFKPAFTAALMAKDFDLALKAGSEMGVAMPTIGLARQFLADDEGHRPRGPRFLRPDLAHGRSGRDQGSV